MFWAAPAFADKFMPVAATEIASQYDSLYRFLVWASFISCVLVIGGFIYFSYIYRRRTENDKTAYISHNSLLEFTWSFIPFLIFMFVFAWGWYIFHQMRTMPKDAFEVQAYAQKWSWMFEYKSGRRSGDLVVPLGVPVKVTLASKDVLHSFFVPAFRIKQDAVPGRYTNVWFKAEKAGSFQIFCTEFCGDGHSAMLAKVNVLPQAEFEEWLANDPYKGLSPIDVGQKVYASRCVACHQPTDQRLVGPGFALTFGQQKEFENASALVADENYIRESIMAPAAKVLKGFQNVMPTFAGQLSEEEMAGLVAYIKSLAK